MQVGMKISITLGQFKLAFANPASNIKVALQLLQSSIQANQTHITLLPELWTTGYDLRNAAQYIQPNQEIQNRIEEVCARPNQWLGGSMLFNQNNQIFNTFHLTGPDGTEHYSKIHLFDLMNESKFLAAGSHPHLANTPWGKTALAICYDLRFPELFRAYTKAGANLILISAEWPASRIQHWRTLLQARAIENQVFIAAVNTVGKVGSELFGGCSMVVSPMGEILIEASATQEEFPTVEIDLDLVELTRQRFPFLQDIRTDCYTMD
jgi:omega-amidase